MDDPFCYPGSRVLINKEAIRNAAELDLFERVMTSTRIRAGLPDAPLTVDGYRALHRYIFQDVYGWAGEFRTVDIAKGNSLFCHAAFIEHEMEKRFAAIANDRWRGATRATSCRRAAEHLSELNAIHPFREGNGRTMRAFLKVAGWAAGHEVHLDRIDPAAWLAASRHSFATGDTASMARVIEATVATNRPRPRPPPE